MCQARSCWQEKGWRLNLPRDEVQRQNTVACKSAVFEYSGRWSSLIEGQERLVARAAHSALPTSHRLRSIRAPSFDSVRTGAATQPPRDVERQLCANEALQSFRIVRG